MKAQLHEPIFDNGIRNTHFFNGRLLDSSTFQAEQVANRQQHGQLGRALGYGIVSGLEVALVSDGSDGNPPVLSVNAGLGINRKGEAVELPDRLGELELYQTTRALPPEAGLFHACLRGEDAILPPEAAVYLLVVKPTSRYEDLAPRREFGANGSVESCGRRYVAEGVRFRLEEVVLSELPQLDATDLAELGDLMALEDRASLSLLRNRLAHLCFGTWQQAAFAADPFGRLTVGHRKEAPFLEYGVVDALRKQQVFDALGNKTTKLTDCDVPLAMLFWSKRGVQFVDMWSVRRRIVQPVQSVNWPAPVTDRRLAEGEAIYLQFQEQVAKLTAPGVPQSELASADATAYFRYLPAVGFLPMTGVGSPRGFDYLRFFANLTVRDPVYINGPKLQPLLRQSLAYPAADLSSREYFWLYFVWENAEAIAQNPLSPPQLYLVFTSGHIPFQGDAQYDLARATYSNYGPILPPDQS